jgi:hypothetical protein
VNLTAEARTRIAVGAIVGTYALAWASARTGPVLAMLAFGLAVTPVAGVFVYRGVSKGLGNLVIQSLLVMMSVAIPPIFLLLCLRRLAIGIERTSTFLRNARYLAGSMLVYFALLIAPSLAGRDSARRARARPGSRDLRLDNRGDAAPRCDRRVRLDGRQMGRRRVLHGRLRLIPRRPPAVADLHARCRRPRRGCGALVIRHVGRVNAQPASARRRWLVHRLRGASCSP